MLPTYDSEADLCEVLGPAYPASGVFDEAIRDRQPKESCWMDRSTGAATATEDPWELTFRHLADGRGGHIVARQLSRRGHRTGRAIPMTARISEATGAQLRDAVLGHAPVGPPPASPVDRSALGQIQSNLQQAIGRRVAPG